jgi:hypothetical protein
MWDCIMLVDFEEANWIFLERMQKQPSIKKIKISPIIYFIKNF